MPSKMPDDKAELSTIPSDPRFQQQNATAWCFCMFVDYQRCTRALGKSHKPCEFFKKAYTTICPTSWLEKWEDQLQKNIFPVDLPPQQ